MMQYNSWHQGSIDLSKIGFFLTTSEAEAQLEVDLSQVQQCLLLIFQLQLCRLALVAQCKDWMVLMQPTLTLG